MANDLLFQSVSQFLSELKLNTVLSNSLKRVKEIERQLESDEFSVEALGRMCKLFNSIRNGTDWNMRTARIANTLERFPVDNCTGEIPMLTFLTAKFIKSLIPKMMDRVLAGKENRRVDEAGSSPAKRKKLTKRCVENESDETSKQPNKKKAKELTKDISEEVESSLGQDLKACMFCGAYIGHVRGDMESLKRLDRHLRDNHKGEKGAFFCCTKCPQTFRSCWMHWNHKKLQACTGVIYYELNPSNRRSRITCYLKGDKCEFCGEYLGSKMGSGVAAVTLGNHIRIKHKDVKGTFFRCSIHPDAKVRYVKNFARDHARKVNCSGVPEYNYDFHGQKTRSQIMDSIAVDNEFGDRGPPLHVA